MSIVQEHPLGLTDTSPVDALRLELDQARARIDEIQATRKDLIQQCADVLTAAGVECRVAKRHTSAGLKAGQACFVVESYERLGNGRVFHLVNAFQTRFGAASCQRPDGPRNNGGRLVMHHGRHDLVLVDGEDLLLVKDPEWTATEDDRKRGTRRLRELARRDGVRVRVRDLAITLIDPMNNIVHEGDVVSAFAWLLGIDIEAAEEW